MADTLESVMGRYVRTREGQRDTRHWQLTPIEELPAGEGGGGGDADTLEGQSLSQVRVRASHTGTQAISTITGLQAALDRIPTSYILAADIVLDDDAPVDVFTAPVEANSLYRVQIVYGISKPAIPTAEMVGVVVVPVGAAMAGTFFGNSVDDATADLWGGNTDAQQTSTSLLEYIAAFVLGGYGIYADYLLQTAGTAGNLIIRVNQISADDERTIWKGAHMIVQKIGAIAA